MAEVLEAAADPDVAFLRREERPRLFEHGALGPSARRRDEETIRELIDGVRAVFRDRGERAARQRALRTGDRLPFAVLEAHETIAHRRARRRVFDARPCGAVRRDREL